MNNFDIRELVPKAVFERFGQRAWQFVSSTLLKMLNFTHGFFNEYCKKNMPGVVKVTILVNNWHLGGPFQWRGLRTVSYINEQVKSGKTTAELSQHVGGSTNASDINVILHYSDGRKVVLDSDKVFDIIIANKAVFMAAGLTTLEDKRMTKGWTHMDCRFTGMDDIYIVPAP